MQIESLQKKYQPQFGAGATGAMAPIPSMSQTQPIPPQRMIGGSPTLWPQSNRGMGAPPMTTATQAPAAGLNLPEGMTGLPGLPRSLPGNYDPTYLADVQGIRGTEEKREGQRDTVLDRLLNVLGPPVVGGQYSGMPADYWQAQARVAVGGVRQQFAQRRNQLAAQRRRGDIGEGSYRNELNRLARAEASEVARAQAGVRTQATEQAEQAQMARAQALLGTYQAIPSDRYRLEMPEQVPLNAPNASFSVRGGGGGRDNSGAAQAARRAKAQGVTHHSQLSNDGLRRMAASAASPEERAAWNAALVKRRQDPWTPQ